MSIYYFDNAATTQLDEAVLEEILPYLKNEYGNPSSIYSIGRSAKALLENSRDKIAALLNCKPSEIILLRAEASLTTPRYSGFQPHAAKTASLQARLSILRY